MCRHIIKIDWGDRIDFWNWCDQHGIKVEYDGCRGYRDHWLIENETQYLMTMLRWG